MLRKVRSWSPIPMSSAARLPWTPRRRSKAPRPVCDTSFAARKVASRPSCDGAETYRADIAWNSPRGYRDLKLNDSLMISENLSTVPAPGTFNLQDSFQTQNEFNGVELGMLLQTRRGRWTMDWVSRFRWVSTNASSIIGGQTIINDGRGTVTYPGGLLAQTSNIGTYNTNDFAVVPELGVNLGFDLTPRFRVLVGYTMIYWSRVLRAGDQIDREINPNLIPPPSRRSSVPCDPNRALRGPTSGPRGSASVSRDNGKAPYPRPPRP